MTEEQFYRVKNMLLSADEELVNLAKVIILQEATETQVTDLKHWLLNHYVMNGSLYLFLLRIERGEININNYED